MNSPGNLARKWAFQKTNCNRIFLPQCISLSFLDQLTKSPEKHRHKSNMATNHSEMAVSLQANHGFYVMTKHILGFSGTRFHLKYFSLQLLYKLICINPIWPPINEKWLSLNNSFSFFRHENLYPEAFRC